MPRLSEFQLVDFPFFDVIENNAVRRHVSTVSVCRKTKTTSIRSTNEERVGRLSAEIRLVANGRSLDVCCVARTNERVIVVLEQMSETTSFLRDCIDLAIDGFLFRGVTPSDHYYRFSQSFPKAFTLLSQSTNSSSLIATPKQQQQSHRPHSAKRTGNVPLLDLSSLSSNVLLEQQPVSTIHSTGLTIKTKKPVYSPKDVRRPLFSHGNILTPSFSSRFRLLRRPIVVWPMLVVQRRKLLLSHRIVPTLLSRPPILPRRPNVL